MASDDVLKLQANADQAVSESERFVGSLFNIDEAMRRLKGATVELDATNNTARATIRGMTDDGNKFVATYIHANGQSRLFRASIQEVDKAAQDAANSIRRLSDAQKEANQRAAIFGSLKAGDLAAQDAILDRIQRAITYRQKLTAEIQAERKANEQNAAALAKEEAIRVRNRDRNAAAFGASVGGGNLSFTSLGRAVNSPGSGAAANFALGLGAGVAANVADSAIQGFVQAKESAIQFNKQLGLINTISKDGQSTTESWAAALRGLSKDFNIDEVEVAKGAYQGLSNQIIKGSSDTKFLTDALTLAKITDVDAVTSVNALSAVLNSYGAKAESSTEITNQLFRAVDLGNFKLGEIGTSLGRVTSLAGPLGISFKEVLASLETTTIKGVKADEALSGLSNLYSELLKPSEALKGSLNRLGFATSEQGIATLKYSGFLKALIEDAKKSGISLSEILPNIRGLREAFLEASDGLDGYNKNLEKTTDSSGAAAEALLKVRAAAGEETKRGFNELKEAASHVWDGLLRSSDAAVGKIRELQAANKAEEDERRRRQDEFRRNLGQPTFAEEQAQKRAQEKATREEGLKLFEKTPSFARDTPQEAAAKVAAQAIDDSRKKEEGLHQDRLKRIAELKAKKSEEAFSEKTVAQATSKEFADNLDKRVAALNEARAKGLDVGGGDALGAALKLATSDQATKLIDERIEQLKQLANNDLIRTAKQTGKEFILDKSLEDAKKAAEEVVKLRREQRDSAIGKVSPEGRAQALAAVTSGRFGSLTDLGAPGGELLKAQEALNEAEREQLEIEQKSLDLLKQKTEEIKKQQEAAKQDTARFEAAQARAQVSEALKKQGPANAITDILDQEVKDIDSQREGALTGGNKFKPGTAAFFRAQYDAQRAKRDKEIAIEQARQESYRGEHGTKGQINVGDYDDARGIGDSERARRAQEAAEKAGGYIGPESGSPNKRTVAKAAKAASSVVKIDSAAEGISNTLERAARDLKKIKIQDTAYEGYRSGGLVGGSGHGDIVPAALEPGEYVWDSKTTRDNYTVIEAIHQGRSTSDVTNVGDLNIYMTGGDNARATVDEIGRQLERRIRQGTIRFNRR